MKYSAEEFIKAIKIPEDLSGGISQVSSDLNRDKAHIYVNGMALSTFFTETITASNLALIWKELFAEIVANEFNLWQNFANQYLHQGGFLYPLERLVFERLTEKFIRRKNQLFFEVKPSEKALYIDFESQNNRR